MCGIAGWFNAPEFQSQLDRMLGALSHRGPESRGVYSNLSVSLGNSRLAFIDIPLGRQPLCNEDGTMWITCNGEIYNHEDLRDALTSGGHIFKTHSDIEVILHLYEEQGVNGFAALNGQFAFALWDGNKNQLILCRDRIGICPLFYTKIYDTIFFASEIKAFYSVPEFSAEINLLGLESIWTFWSLLPGMTSVKGVSEVRPSQYIIFNGSHTTSGHYWQINYYEEGYSHQHSIEKLDELLSDAVYIRLKAEVPIAAYLSGGIDSSLLCALAQKYTTNLHTFSLEFENPAFDESTYQKRVSEYLEIHHSLRRCSAEDLINNFEKTIWHVEAPQLRAGPFSMLLLSETVKTAGFKAVMTGEGGDELFVGYDIYKEAAVRRFVSRDPSSEFRRLLVNRLYAYLSDRAKLRGLGITLLSNLDMDEPYSSHVTRWANTSHLQGYFLPEIKDLFRPDQIKANLLQILPSEFSHWNWLQKAQVIEVFTLLSSYLLSSQGDRVAMANSIEGRYPFLDHRVIEFANSLPSSLKLKSLTQDKWILRKMSERYLPKDIAHRGKFPYRAPIADMFRGKGKELLMDLLSRDSIKRVGLFKYPPVEKLRGKVMAGSSLSEMEEMAMLGIATTQVWYQQFIQKVLYAR